MNHTLILLDAPNRASYFPENFGDKKQRYIWWLLAGHNKRIVVQKNVLHRGGHHYELPTTCIIWFACKCIDSINHTSTSPGHSYTACGHTAWTLRCACIKVKLNTNHDDMNRFYTVVYVVAHHTTTILFSDISRLTMQS